MSYRASYLMRVAGIALLYALLAKLVLGYFSANGVISIIWPSSGLAVSALLIGGRKYWPAIFIGALAGNLIAGSPVGLSALIASGYTLEALSCLWLLRHIGHFDSWLVHTRDFMYLGIAAALSSCVSAMMGVTALWLTGLLQLEMFAQNLLLWWQGDTLGIILFVPLFVVWRQLPQGWFSRDRLLETIACFGLAFLAGQIIFLGWFHDIFGISARGFWMFLFVVWSALRFGRHGTLLILCMTAVQMLLGTELQTQGFTNNLVPNGALNFWFYMLGLTVTGISLALGIEKNRQAEASLTQSHDLLSKLSHHVPGVIYQYRLYADGRSCFPFASEAMQYIFELAPDHVREDASDVFAMLHPEDYDGILASIEESARTLSLWRQEFRMILPRQGVCWRLGESFPERMADGSVLWHGFITDISERKQANIKIQRLTHLYKALSEVNQAIVRMEQQAELFPLVCRCAVEFGGMNMSWVGQHDEKSAFIVPVASYGSNLAYLDDIVISSEAHLAAGQGPAGKALRENRSVVINDFLTNPTTVPWQARAKNTGWNSVAVFPIPRGGKPFAVLVVHHDQMNAFDEDVILLLEEMSKDVAFALDNFDRETRRKAAEDSLRLAASVYESSSEAMMVTDSENRIVAINPAFTAITGYFLEEIAGESPNILMSGRHDAAFYQGMWGEINNSGKWQGEIWDQRKNGEVYPKWLTINTVYDNDGSVLHRIALFTDISQKVKAEKIIWHQANFDSLTELPNRQMFHDRLSQEIKKAHRSRLPLALLFLDLDGFKEVNDTLGHDVGDALLKETAQRLFSCVRESDTVARLGGDEFTIILGELDDPSSADRVAQDILQKLSELFRLGDEVVYVTASIGVTLYPNDAANIDELIKNADQAMYAAKNQGRNRYNYFTSSLQEAAQSRRRLTIDLRNALNGNQFWVAYQPILELATGAIHKAEALIRWQHPTRELVSPAEFIPIAEETGLIIEIGDWVFREAAEQVKTWRASLNPEFQISVNKSPVQFHNVSHTHMAWYDYLQQLGLPGQSIAVEITEGLLLDASALVTDRLLEFRDAGMQVAIDDFGTGYSALSYLKKFDIDYLKIDQSFTRNLAPGSDDMVLCEAIIQMAHKLGLLVIAEGVETPEQRDLLIAAGCDYGQGYLFSRPVRAAEFEKLFQANSAHT